jgi:hypothetical protein
MRKLEIASALRFVALCMSKNEENLGSGRCNAKAQSREDAKDEGGNIEHPTSDASGHDDFFRVVRFD